MEICQILFIVFTAFSAVLVGAFIGKVGVYIKASLWHIACVAGVMSYTIAVTLLKGII